MASSIGGWKHLVACGCFSTIIILDPAGAQVKWAPENYYHDHKNPYCLRLASADMNGAIIVWDVVNATIMSEFNEPGCGVLVDDEYAASSVHPKDASTSKGVLQEIINALTPDRSLTSAGPTDAQAKLHANCLQVLYHSYRKECAVFVYRRELVLVNLYLMRPIATVPLERGTASFLHVYSCQQRDVLICLHENGAISVYARRGIAFALENQSANLVAMTVASLSASQSIRSIATARTTGDDVCSVSDYELIAFAEGTRRLRQSAVSLQLTVDRTREVAFTVTTTDGRVQFWELSSLPLQARNDGVGFIPSGSLACLTDLIAHEPGEPRPPKLCLQMSGIYTASQTDPTVCRVCPQHLIKPLAQRLGCHSLVAVGNSRGGVQIWDLHSGCLWREYALLPVPVLGIEWLTLASNSTAAAAASNTNKSPLSDPSPAVPYHLGLFIHGWLPKEKLIGSASARLHTSPPVEPSSGAADDIKLAEGHNYTLLVNLSTGYMHNFRITPTSVDSTSNASSSSHVDHWARPGGLPFGTPVHRGMHTRASVSSMLFEHPIEAARISHSGQYLALIIWNECVELWNLCSMQFIKRIPSNSGAHAVALDWYQSVSKQAEFHSLCSSEFLALSQDASHMEASSSEWNTSPTVQGQRQPGSPITACQRESFILCTTQGNLRLIVVEGSNVDSTTISNAVLHGLPTYSVEHLSAVAWFADLIAFGTADGFVAVRDLHSKKTLVRLNSGSSWFSSPDSTGTTAEGTASSASSSAAINALSAASRYGTGVRRLAFLPGAPSYSRLLALQHDSLFVWQPRDMVLLCMARFGGHVQRCLISADWAHPIQSPSDPVFCLIVGADGALRLVQAGDSSAEMTPIGGSPVSTTQTTQTHMIEQQTTRFFGSSPIPDQLHAGAGGGVGREPLFVPSILASKTALTIRHLLQHQPWHSQYLTKTRPSVPIADDLLSVDADELENKCPTPPEMPTIFELDCPDLAPGFAKVQASVSTFLRDLTRKSDLSTAFLRSNANIVERCLLTARLFGDAYETRFWHVVANRLQTSTSKATSSSSRYSMDLSWDWLSDNRVYREAACTELETLERKRSTAAHRERCIHRLILHGRYDRAVSLLLETPPNATTTHPVNMYRACLLASIQSSLGAQPPGAIDPETSPLRPSLQDTHLSTVKLVATNFLSNGQLDAGIELLCLIGLCVDACRYLESFDQWERSVNLAKCTLPQSEVNKVLRRWAGYLSSPQVNRKDFAVLIYVLLDEHNTALKLLYGLNQYQLAARYLEACLQVGVLHWTEEHDALYRNILLEFCKILIKLGHHDSASYYCRLTGELGETLKNEIEFLLA